MNVHAITHPGVRPALAPPVKATPSQPATNAPADGAVDPEAIERARAHREEHLAHRNEHYAARITHKIEHKVEKLREKYERRMEKYGLPEDARARADAAFEAFDAELAGAHEQYLSESAAGLAGIHHEFKGALHRLRAELKEIISGLKEQQISEVSAVGEEVPELGVDSGAETDAASEAVRATVAETDEEQIAVDDDPAPVPNAEAVAAPEGVPGPPIDVEEITDDVNAFFGALRIDVAFAGVQTAYGPSVDIRV